MPEMFSLIKAGALDNAREGRMVTEYEDPPAPDGDADGAGSAVDVDALVAAAQAAAPADLPQSQMYRLGTDLAAGMTPQEIVELKAAFQRYDVSGDGVLDASEMVAVFDAIGEKVRVEQVRGLISNVSSMGEETINFDEYVNMLSQIHEDDGLGGQSEMIAKSRLERRLIREMQELRDDPVEGVEYSKRRRKLCVDMVVWGPAGTPFEGGRFVFELDIPPGYPFLAPTVRGLTPMYHPNVVLLSTGVASIQPLLSQWHPDWDLRVFANVLVRAFKAPDMSRVPEQSKVVSAFATSMPSTGVEFARSAADVYRESAETYNRVARAMTVRYAMAPAVVPGTVRNNRVV